MQLLPNGSLVSPTHGAIAPFRLIRPHTVAEALSAKLAEPTALFHAGGIDTVRLLRDGAAASAVIDLNRIAALGEIAASADAIVLGAAVTHFRIESDPMIAAACPSLARAWRTIGNIRVRWTGTVGGNVMMDDPLYDGLVLLTAVDATFEFATRAGERRERRERPAATKIWSRPAEALLMNVRVAEAGKRRVVFDRSLKPLVSVAIGGEAANGRVGARRAVIGCAFAAPICVPIDVADLERAVVETLARLDPPIEDALASSDYRKRMIGVLLRRGLVRLAAEG